MPEDNGFRRIIRHLGKEAFAIKVSREEAISVWLECLESMPHFEHFLTLDDPEIISCVKQRMMAEPRGRAAWIFNASEGIE